jgi:hypothetical protein
MKFANIKHTWLNRSVKNSIIDIKNKINSRYLTANKSKNLSKSTDINVLLNRVRTNQKNESRKKLYFSAAASTGLLIFGFLIF